jgi:hypothetical protein
VTVAEYEPAGADFVLIKGVLLGLLLVCSPAHALEVTCGGYNPDINDHVEWATKIVGAEGDEAGLHFKVRQTQRFFILTRLHTRTVIDRRAATYVVYGPAGKAIEWSRKTLGEGCDFSK